MVVLNRIKPDMQPGPHSHPFEQLVLILQGRTRLHVGDEVLECGPGSMVRVPPNVVHYAEPVGDEVCLNLDVFAPVRADYLHLVNMALDKQTKGGDAMRRRSIHAISAQCCRGLGRGGRPAEVPAAHGGSRGALRRAAAPTT